jgi:hypothetical protein
MKIISKRPFTLLETFIALAWSVILITTLSYFYLQMATINNQSEAIQKDSFQRRYMENRLSLVFPQTIKPTKEKQNFYFFTYSDPGGIFKPGSPKSLFFAYDNETDVDKPMSNEVLGEIFLDPQGRLCLATWVSPQRWINGVNPRIKKEILLDGVDSFTMEFFIPPDKKWDSKAPPEAPTKTVVKPSPEGGWTDSWSQDYKLLPGMIRLEIKRKGTVENYIFPFSNTARQIIYN